MANWSQAATKYAEYVNICIYIGLACIFIGTYTFIFRAKNVVLSYQAQCHGWLLQLKQKGDR